MDKAKTKNHIDSKEEARSKGNYTQYFTFVLGKEVYGLPVKNVREVIELNDVFSIPRTPPHIRGVINLRGEVVPVIDLSQRFYEKDSAVTILTSIVFVEVKHNGNLVLVGILVDEVCAVVDIYDEDIGSIPDFSTKINSEFIKDIGKVDEEFIVLLSIENVLDIKELSDMQDWKK